MFLKEFEGRALFRKYNIPISEGTLLKRAGNFREDLQKFLEKEKADEFVLKAQLLSGKRRKHGGIIFVRREEAVEATALLFEQQIHDEEVEEILIQKRLKIERELYVSVVIDRFLRQPVLVFSPDGGVEIEDADSVLELPFPLHSEDVLIEDGLKDKIVSIGEKLYTLLMQEDALLAEINPLILTPNGELVAADSKVIIDSNSLTRHPSFTHKNVRGHSALELEALQSGLAYVELDGDIAIIGNGAGLVMATLDGVTAYGGRPANFCDVGGGASAEMMKKAMDIVLQKPEVKALFLNIFGGITHCDEVAKGIVEGFEGRNLPIVVRLVGTHEEAGRKILENAGFVVHHSFEEAAQKAARLLS